MKENEKKQAHLLIITGLSGAGKTKSTKMLEDLGYYCVDNLPVALLPRFSEIIHEHPYDQKMTAVVIDAREGENFSPALCDALQSLNSDKVQYAILFLEASDEVLVRRFSETRRKHPLSDDGSNLQAIVKERKLLESIREKANFIVDTTYFSTKDLREKLISLMMQISNQTHPHPMHINILSFGYKAGIPIDADIMMDVRFLPNPFYDCELKQLNGLNDEIAEFVMDNEVAKSFISKALDLILFVIPLYHKEGKNQLTLAFGCTGGKHRSVAIAELIRKTLEKKGYHVNIQHRDIYNDDQISES